MANNNYSAANIAKMAAAASEKVLIEHIESLVGEEVRAVKEDLQDRIDDLEEEVEELKCTTNEHSWAGRDLRLTLLDANPTLHDLQKLAVLDVLFERMTLEQLESIQKFARAGE